MNQKEFVNEQQQNEREVQQSFGKPFIVIVFAFAAFGLNFLVHSWRVSLHYFEDEQGLSDQVLLYNPKTVSQAVEQIYKEAKHTLGLLYMTVKSSDLFYMTGL